MSKRDSYISHTLKRGDSVYVYYWEDDIIVRFQNIEGKLKAFVTNRDGKVLRKIGLPMSICKMHWKWGS